MAGRKRNRQIAAGPSAAAVRVSLCMIVRDSARTLPAALASIRPWVDEMVVVDTESTDETPQIAKQAGARLFHFPWCDSFSAARNESLRHARGDWLFWMDSDDVIDEANGRKLRALADRPLDQSPMAYLMQVHCPEPETDGICHITAVDHVKMFRNLPQLRFENRIHEQVLGAIRQLNGALEWTDIFVVHAGSDCSPEGRHRKQERDLRLLQLELQDKPDEPFALFNLGMTYADMHEPTLAMPPLTRCLDRSHPNDSIVRKAYALLIGCHTQLNQPDEALAVCQKGLELYPKDAELRYRFGVLLRQAGRLAEAEAAFRAALRDDDERHLSSMVQGITGYLSRQELAALYTDTNRPELAEIQWREVLAEQPRYRTAWRGLADLVIGRRMLVTARVAASRMAEHPSLRCESRLVLADVRQAHGDIDGTKREIEQTAQEFPADLPLLQRRSQFYFEHGTLDEAQTALEDLLHAQPADASAHYNLGNVHMRAGRLTLAAQCFRESLRHRPDWPPTHLALGYAQKGLGDDAAAGSAWLEARRLAPADALVLQAGASLAPATIQNA